jgi:uncharacterized iron-regulated membrane protein
MSTSNESSGVSALYRAVWHWHFIAGLLVIPFLVLLAVTGAVYLFSPELDHLVYRTWDTFPPGNGASPSMLIERVEHETGGQVLQFSRAERSDRAIRMTVYVPPSGTRTAFVDPRDGHVVGTVRYGGVMQVVRKVHSLQYFGPVASWLVEAAAGWAIVLVGTGVYLWWPRGRGGALPVRGTPRERVFWRDTHAVVGIFAGMIGVFLAVTGMPWSDVWGGKVQEWATSAGLNRPDPPAEVVPDWLLENFTPQSAPAGHQHHHGGEIKPALPWALEKAPAPESHATHNRATIDVDAAVAAFDRAALPKPYSVALPQGPRGAFVGTHMPDKIEDVRVIYIDRYDGRVLDDVGYARFGPAAQAIEWGIAVHQGQQFGPINRYLMLAGCIAIVVLAVSAVTMWWKRRPKGSLGLPPPPMHKHAFRGLLAIVIPLAIFYPLVGATLIIALLVDAALRVLQRRRGVIA